MPNLSKRRLSRNTLTAAQPDLFSRLPALPYVAPEAARKLAHRYGLTIPHAITVARLAGLGGSEARQ